MHLGIDIGGTKMAAVLLDGSGALHWRDRAATPPRFDAAVEIVARWADDADARLGRRVTLGLCAPGLIQDGAARHAVNLPWSRPGGVDAWVAALEARLARPVALCNDADAFALAESRREPPATRRLAALTLGTGVGGGLVVDGRLVQGAHGLAGEFGHLPLPWRQPQDPPARICGCGRFDCAELSLSGEGVRRLWAAMTGGAAMPEPDALLAHMAQGEATATELRDRYADMLARLAALLLQVAAPDRLVLGGSLSRLPGLAAAVEAATTRWTLGGVAVSVRCGGADGEGSAEGAAWLGAATDVEHSSSAAGTD